MSPRFANASRIASLCLAGVLPLSLGLSNVAAVATLLLALPVALSPSRPRVSRRLRWPAIGLALLWAAHLLSTALSPHPHWNKLVEEFWIKLLLFALPFVVTPRSNRRALGIFVAVGILVAAFAVTQHFHGIDPWRGGTVNRFGERYQSVGFFGHHLSYGGHLLVLCCAVMAMLLREPRRRVLLGIGLVVCLLAMQWSIARSAQLGLLAAMLAVAARGSVRARWATLALIGLTLLTVVATPQLRARWTNMEDTRSGNTRLLLWQSSLDAIREEPMGFGPGNFGAMLERFEREGDYESRAHAHNDLIMYGVVSGVPGMLAYLLFWGACGVALWRRSRRGGTASLAAFAAVIGFAVASLFQVYQTDDEVEMAIYFLLGLGMADEEHDAA